MGLWVLDDRVMEFVPGTTRYFDDPERPQVATGDTAGLKCDTSGPLPIILVPQPSDDPNDPLNWPLWKRDLITFILSVTSIFATSLGPILAANTLTLSFYFRIIFTKTALLTGYFLLGVGVAGPLLVPSARVWGKRHQFLLGTFILVLASIWGGLAGESPVRGSNRRYNSLLWSRIFQGIGTAPFEALVNAAIGDLYFVHERGKRMALTNLAVFGGAFFTPILVGKMTHTIGWPWSFYFVAIFCAISLPLLYFFCPETAYVRSAHLNIDFASSEDVVPHKNSAESSQLQGDVTATNSIPNNRGDEKKENAPRTSANTPSESLARPNGADIPKQSWSESLRIFNGRKSNESYWKLLLRPFPLFGHPAILWACVIQGTMIGWTVFIGVVLGAIFLGPPLFWDEVKTGYAYTGAFIGALVGFFIAGGLADWSAKFMTRKNGGIYEPEFRIVLVIPQLIFGCAGLFGFGVTAARLIDYHWAVPVAFFGMQVGGMVIGAVAASLYIVDAHRDIAIEAFTCILIFKNFFSFGLTFSAYDWIVKNGIYTTFMVISSVQIVICLLSIPMYIYGKRNRSFFHRHDILKLCGLT